MSTGTEIGILLVLVAANGLLSGAEIAVVSLRSSRLQELVDGGSRGARVLQRLRARPDRFLATVQIGITIIGVTAGAFGGARFGGELAVLLRRWALIAPYAESAAFVLVVGLITYLSLILGELVPKSLALRSAERYALLVARPLEWIEELARPAIWLLTSSSNAVLKLFGDRTDFLETKISLEEVRHMVGEASEGGSVDPGAGMIAARALELSELSASDVMVHRRYVKALPIDAGEEAVRRVFLETGHRRVPIYEGSIDNVVGYLSWRDVVERVWTGRAVVPRELLREAHLVPMPAPATPLLRDMLRMRRHLVVVVDEHGGMAGIVTLEDLLEELVGEIESEHGAPAERVERLADGSTQVLGELALRDVDRELGTALEEEAEADTVSGLLVHLAGDRIPRSGEMFEASDGTKLKVIEASPRRVRRVAVTPVVPVAAREGEESG